MTQKEIFLESLEAMGFEPIKFGEIGYAFQYEDMHFILFTDDDDEHFVRVATPLMSEITDENRIAVLEAMHETGLVLKYVKVNIMFESAVWAIYDHHLTSLNNLTQLLEHIIRILGQAAYLFYRKLSGEDIIHSILSADDDDSDDDIEKELEKMLMTMADE